MIALALFATTAQAQLFWNTNGSSATLTATNWGATAAGPFTVPWANNSNIVFASNSTINYVTNTPVGNISVADGATVTWSAAGTFSTGGNVRTVDVGTNATLDWSSSQAVSTATGTGFIKNGGGTWNIGSANSFTAYKSGFTLNSGTVRISGDYSLGTGPLNINGGTLHSTGNRNYGSTDLNIGGDFTFTGSGNASYPSGFGLNIVRLGNSTRTITNSITSGYRDLGGTITGSEGVGLVFNSTAAGKTYLSNSANTFSGDITINSGEVGFRADGSFGTGDGMAITIDGGTLSNNTAAGAGFSFTLDQNRKIKLGSSPNTAISVSGSNITFDGIISDKSGTIGSLKKTGDATLLLGGTNTYSGSTDINQGSITLRVGSDRLPRTTILNLGQSSSPNVGILQLAGFNQEIVGLNSILGSNTSTTALNTVNNNNGIAVATLKISGAGIYSFGDGTTQNSGVISGNLSLVKSGPGIQILGGSYSYSGTTIINGGELQFNGSFISGASSTSFAVGNGGILSGSGNIRGSGQISIQNGGVIRGDSGSGTDTLTTGSITIQSGGSLFTKVGSSGTNSKISAGGIFSIVNFANGSKLKPSSLAGFSNSGSSSWNILTFANETTLQLAGGSTAEGTIFAQYVEGSGNINSRPVEIDTSSFGSLLNNGDQLTLSRSGNNLVLNFVPVPEPSSIFIVSSVSLGLLAIIRKKVVSRNMKSEALPLA